MSFIKEFFRSIARTFGRIFAYAIIGLIIYFIASNFVSAKSYRIRIFNPSTTQVVNQTNTNPTEYQGLMKRSLVNLNNGNMSANTNTYFTFDITYGLRTCTTWGGGLLNCDVSSDLSVVYWVDSGGNVHNISDSCNLSATRTITANAQSTLWQYRVIGTCTVSSTSILTGFLLEPTFSIYGSSGNSYDKSAVSINSFDITQDESEGDLIINNATANANRIINAIENSNSQNTEIIIDSLDDLDSSIEDLNFSITDNTPPSDMNFFSDIGLSDDTPISNLILMPITLLNAFNSGVSGTCSPFNLGALYGSDLILPCINIQDRLGSNLWSTIDALTSIFIIYELAMLIVSVFNDITSLKDGFNGLYTPKHEGYKARHSADYERVDD